MNFVPEQWWEKSSGVTCFKCKEEGITIQDVIPKLDHVKSWGFDAIGILPYYGGNEYGGLDVIDYFLVDPTIGTMGEFLELINCAHEKGIAIIMLVNLGYCAMNYPAFIKACDDIRRGIDSPESRLFLWSDTGEEKFDRSLAPHFMNDSDGGWHFSERAGKFYWVKWNGESADVALPQFNFGSPIWCEKCKKVIKFWMDTGIDGMIIDAVNWYMNCNWEINYETITGVIHQYSNKYMQPEGAGGFGDDPTKWILSGKYNSVQDYGINIWWTDHDVIGKAIETGDPTFIEEALQSYRDRVVAAGGITFIGPYWHKRVSQEQRILEIATIVTIGEFFYDSGKLLKFNWPEKNLCKVRRLIRALQTYPALQASGNRHRLLTNDDHKFYAFTRMSKDGKERMLVILNFQNETQEVVVKLHSPTFLRDIFSNEKIRNILELQVILPPYGYRIYEITQEA